ncbi:MAG: Mur ligase domain-containing protein, partial [Acidimicrobiia bacterium]
MKTIDITDKNLNNIHIIGIGGAGMSAIATVLAKMGKNISGSDLKNSHVTERLESFGIKVNVPHDEQNINSNIDLIVKSTAINDDNIEIVKAKKMGIDVISRSQMLSAICSCEKSIGVSGSHGKTTTTSMLTSIARASGLNPSFMIGGDVNEIGTNA